LAWKAPAVWECSGRQANSAWARPSASAVKVRPKAAATGRRSTASVRTAQSGWQFISDTVASAGLRRLADDLANGSWDTRHGHLRHQPSYTGPLVLVTAEP